MTITVSGSIPSGTIAAIPSKSEAHRLLTAAAGADRETIIDRGISGPLPEDILATISGLTALGADIIHEGENLRVNPGPVQEGIPQVDCGESGTTLRFLLPAAAILTNRCRFTGRGRLPERPLAPLCRTLAAHGKKFSAGKLPLEISGRLTGSDFLLPGDETSQFLSGLLLALPLTTAGGSVCLTSPLYSAGYVDLTVKILRNFGVMTEHTGNCWRIPPGSRYRSPGRIAVNGDWSNAAVFLAAGTLGRGMTVTGLELDSPQVDRKITELLRQFGAGVKQEKGAVTVTPGNLRGITVDLQEIPDLLPVLAVLGAAAAGITTLNHIRRTRLKESDRPAVMAAMLRRLGAEVQEEPDRLIITGGRERLHGGKVESGNDHRTAMAAALAAAAAGAEVEIADAESVNKSYPVFFRDWQAAGGEVNELVAR